MNKRQIAQKFSKSLNSPEIDKIILFGSVACGEDKADSDIDVFIISNEKSETRDIVMDMVGDIFLDDNVYISVKVLSKKEYESLIETHFISIVEEEGVVIG